MGRIYYKMTVHFDLAKDVGNKTWNWFYHKIKSIFSWAYNKNKISRLLFIYKHGNDIHEHRKQ